jgi:hypothetical protein
MATNEDFGKLQLLQNRALRRRTPIRWMLDTLSQREGKFQYSCIGFQNEKWNGAQ